MNLMRKSIAVWAVSAAFAALTGCSALPVNGPNPGAIADGAAVVGTADDLTGVGYKYAMLDLSAKILPYISEDGGSLSKSFGLGQAPAPEIRLGVGDIVSVSIFESTAGGLFIPQDAGARPGNYVSLPSVTIDRSGGLSVPYAGTVPALGRTLLQVQAEIEKRLSARAIEPQALVTLVTQRSNDVSVVGHVNSPGKFTVQPGGERVLDLIARAGGLKKEPYESSITIQRGARRATVAFNSLITYPNENIFVGTGDTIYVYGESKSYLVFGAAGQNQKFTFGDETLSLGEAVGQAGGLLDGRADPAQTFLYRKESRKTLEKMGVDISRFGDAKEIPTIYRANFRDPATYFASREFKMRDKDIIYVGNASSVELIKFLNVVDSIAATSANVSADMVTTRDGYHQLGRAAHN